MTRSNNRRGPSFHSPQCPTVASDQLWGDVWCNGQHVCFPSLPPMLEYGFELGLEFSGFSMWHFLKLVVRGFLWVLQFPSLLHRLMVSANKIKLTRLRFKLCQTYQLNCPFAPRGTRHVARYKRLMCCT